ncbi:MAG: gamma-glutamyl-gamma-aminobutyrate hydrolase family protein, partial [Pygmaiobacter sp.]
TCRVGMVEKGHSPKMLYMKSKYSAAVRRAGGVPVWLGWTRDDKAIRAMRDRCDAFLFTGGEDVDPALYGQARFAACGKANALRDDFEAQLLAQVLPTGKPILGICRGCQMLNAALGGTLYQDLPQNITECHLDFARRGTAVHGVHIVPGTTLATVFGAVNIGVNSLHHQAVWELAPSLIVAARSEQGVIEAVELPQHPFCVGVQWHPEHLAACERAQQKLFDVWIERAAEVKRRSAQAAQR